MFEKAKHPESITVGLVWQFKKDEDAHCFKHPYPRPEQIRIEEIDADDSKGACWARSKTQKII